MLKKHSRLLVEIPREFQPLNWIYNSLQELNYCNVLVISDDCNVATTFTKNHNYHFYNFNSISKLKYSPVKFDVLILDCYKINKHRLETLLTYNFDNIIAYSNHFSDKELILLNIYEKNWHHEKHSTNCLCYPIYAVELQLDNNIPNRVFIMELGLNKTNRIIRTCEYHELDGYLKEELDPKDALILNIRCTEYQWFFLMNNYIKSLKEAKRNRNTIFKHDIAKSERNLFLLDLKNNYDGGNMQVSNKVIIDNLNNFELTNEDLLYNTYIIYYFINTYEQKQVEDLELKFPDKVYKLTLDHFNKLI